MNREQAKELLPIITAFAEGKSIEICDSKGVWEDITKPTFQNPPHDYRIKPEPPVPTFRPFNKAELELLPGYSVKHKSTGYIRMIDRYDPADNMNSICFSGLKWTSAEELLDEYLLLIPSDEVLSGLNKYTERPCGVEVINDL